jgi:hypothetical protein
MVKLFFGEGSEKPKDQVPKKKISLSISPAKESTFSEGDAGIDVPRAAVKIVAMRAFENSGKALCLSPRATGAASP